MTSDQSLPVFRDDVTDHDADCVRRIVESTGFFTTAEVEVAVELATERLAKGETSGYEFLFCEQDARTIGYACYGPIACTVGSYDLYWIAVEPGRQGRGVGARLLAETEARIRSSGGRQVYIETSGRPQYAPTRQFYLRQHYEVAAVLPDFYNTGDDKVVFVKRL